MFFDKNNLSVNVLDVIDLKQEHVNIFTSKRNFHALSFRYSANTVFHTETKTHKLTDNMLCFVPSYVEYTRTSERDDLIAIHFHISNYHFDQIETWIPKDIQVHQMLFRNILTCWNDKKRGYEYNCNALLYQILSLCYQEQSVTDEEHDSIYPSVKFLEEHFNDPTLTIEAIAEKSFISTVYFRKLFKARYGISPIKHIINLRMEYAVNLMQMGYYSLHEVAKLSGYEDYSYFSSEFKRVKGISPSNFRYIT